MEAKNARPAAVAKEYIKSLCLVLNENINNKQLILPHTNPAINDTFAMVKYILPLLLVSRERKLDQVFALYHK